MLTILLLAAGSAGCEEDPASGVEADVPFSLYGVVSSDLDTQSVRVYPLENTPTFGVPEHLEVDVYSTDLQTGVRRTWGDSTVVDSRGRYGHVFWAPFRAEHGRTYRVEAVRRSDGSTSFTEVRVPAPVTVRIDERDAPLLHVLVEGDGVRMAKPEALYVVGVDEPAVQYNIRYHGTEQQNHGQWRTTFNMIVDYDFIRFHFAHGPYCFSRPPLFALKLRAQIGDVVWDPPGGAFDPNVLSVGRTMSNVQNGHGFVGGGYFLEAALKPSRETVESACFTYAFPDDE